MIQIKNLKKSFRTEDIETLALNEVNLHVKEGEFVAIIQRCSWFDDVFHQGPERRMLIDAVSARNSHLAHAGEHVVSPGEFKQALGHLEVLVDRVFSVTTDKNRERMSEAKRRLNRPPQERMRKYLSLIQTDLDARTQ